MDPSERYLLQRQSAARELDDVIAHLTKLRRRLLATSVRNDGVRVPAAKLEDVEDVWRVSAAIRHVNRDARVRVAFVEAIASARPSARALAEADTLDGIVAHRFAEEIEIVRRTLESEYGFGDVAASLRAVAIDDALHAWHIRQRGRDKWTVLARALASAGERTTARALRADWDRRDSLFAAAGIMPVRFRKRARRVNRQ